MKMKIDIGVKELTKINFWRAVAAEFLGCLFFLLAVTLVALQWGPISIPANNVEIGIGIGLSITSLAQALGHVSGGHLNPAVSLGMILVGRVSVLRGIFYIIAQVVGGVVGAALTSATVPYEIRKAVNLGCTLLAPGVKPEQGFALELLFTFSLVFFVFSITDPKKGGKIDGYGVTLGIGINILVAHVCLIPITGCGINPARSFGPAVVMNEWKDHWVYWIGPIVGAILASIIYPLIFYVSDDDDDETANEIQLRDSSNLSKI